jgi:hypothetical protein
VQVVEEFGRRPIPHESLSTVYDEIISAWIPVHRVVEAGLRLLALAVDLNESHLKLWLGRHEEELVWDLLLSHTLAKNAAEAIDTLMPDLEPLLLTEYVIVQIEMALLLGYEAHLVPVDVL